MRRGASESVLAQRVEEVLGVSVVASAPLSGGQVGQTVRCTLGDGCEVVVKASPGTPLDVEAFMLRYLRQHSALPVPAVLYADEDLLVETFVKGSGRVPPAAERHAGALLAELHGITAEAFGLERDTLIGPFPLENAWSDSWPAFYAERRLSPMARVAAERGQLAAADRKRVERLAAELPARFDAEPAPSLIHGDVWGGNVLAREGQIAAFLDPAIYYAHSEVELAFIDLFHTFGDAFHVEYQSRRPIDAGYGAWRRNLCQVFPLLVHVALFGGSSVAGLRARLARLGV